MASSRKEFEELHRLVDALPAEDVPRAREFLAQLRVERLLAEAPEDDEPLTGEGREAIREAEQDVARGDVISHEELLRELGLDSDSDAT